MGQQQARSPSNKHLTCHESLRDDAVFGANIVTEMILACP